MIRPTVSLIVILNERLRKPDEFFEDAMRTDRKTHLSRL